MQIQVLAKQRRVGSCMSMLQQWQSVGSCSNTKHNTNADDGDDDDGNGVGDEESSSASLPATVQILFVVCPVCLRCGKCKKSMRRLVHLPIRTRQINAPSARKDTPRCLACWPRPGGLFTCGMAGFPDCC